MFSGPVFSFIGRMERAAVLGGKGRGPSETLLPGLDTGGVEAGLVCDDIKPAYIIPVIAIAAILVFMALSFVG